MTNNHKLINNYNEGLISALIQTNLSAAFNTVDHNILLKKIHHFGIRLLYQSDELLKVKCHETTDCAGFPNLQSTYIYP